VAYLIYSPHRQLGRFLANLAAVACGLVVMSTSAQESFDCLIEPNVMVELSSSEFGVLASINVDEADVVAAGDVLATLHNDVERASLALTRARAESDSEVELLRHDYEFNLRKRRRIELLQDQQAISPQTADEVRTAEELARLRLRAADEKQRTVRLEAQRDALSLKRRTITSPVDGVVAKRYKSAGEYVEGDAILQLAQLDPLRITVVLPITMFGQIEVGMQGTIVPELPIDGDFVASVISIDPVMDSATATFGVRLSLPNPDHRLPPGLRCSVALHQEDTPQEPDRQLAQKPSLPHTGPPLLSAMNPSAPPANPPGDNLVESPAEPIEACSTLGPIDEPDKADQLASQLVRAGVVPDRRSTATRSGKPLWIVMAPGSNVSSRRLLERVRDAGVSDFQMYRRGRWEGRISFGVYSGTKTAERRRRQLTALGFATELVDRNAGQPQIWFDVPRPADDPLVSEIIDDAGLDVRIQEVSCPRLASR